MVPSASTSHSTRSNPAGRFGSHASSNECLQNGLVQSWSPVWDATFRLLRHKCKFGFILCCWRLLFLGRSAIRKRTDSEAARLSPRHSTQMPARRAPDCARWRTPLAQTYRSASSCADQSFAPITMMYCSAYLAGMPVILIVNDLSVGYAEYLIGCKHRGETWSIRKRP